MELGDLLSCYTLEDFNINVAILAIMELGDLLKPTETTAAPIARRNPRYNGIGWFTLWTSMGFVTPPCRNPRYNGIGWFT